jgi:hypothetical protein
MVRPSLSSLGQMQEDVVQRIEVNVYFVAGEEIHSCVRDLANASLLGAA